MRRHFQIYYGENNADKEKAGLRYKPTGKDMVVMNSSGVFFVFNGEPYYPSIRRLSDAIGTYDIRWVDDGSY
jgi:hypothetical protein